METFETRLIAALLLLALTFVCGFLPPYVFEHLKKRSKARRLARKQAQHSLRSRPITSNSTSFVSSSNAQVAHAHNDNVSQLSNGTAYGDDLSNDSTEHVIKTHRRKRTASICSTSSIASRANLSSTKVLQAFMFFGGGVLLATCFCHLIPEARENFNSYMKKHGGLPENHSHNHLPVASSPSHVHNEDDGHIETRTRPSTNLRSGVLYDDDQTSASQQFTSKTFVCIFLVYLFLFNYNFLFLFFSN